MSQVIPDRHWRWRHALPRFLVEAVVLGKQSPNQLVRKHPISRSWLVRTYGKQVNR